MTGRREDFTGRRGRQGELVRTSVGGREEQDVGLSELHLTGFIE